MLGDTNCIQGTFHIVWNNHGSGATWILFAQQWPCHQSSLTVVKGFKISWEPTGIHWLPNMCLEVCCVNILYIYIYMTPTHWIVKLPGCCFQFHVYACLQCFLPVTMHVYIFFTEVYQVPISQFWLREKSSLSRFLQRLGDSMDCHISTAFRKDFARAEAKMALKLFIRSLHHAAEMALDPESPGFLGMFFFFFERLPCGKTIVFCRCSLASSQWYMRKLISRAKALVPPTPITLGGGCLGHDFLIFFRGP